ncbi:PEP-CTERM/exosortase system-associated acyltransferase [uncultured Kushneria sp.]|uniref:PEP-CTERM/exosortase system-associated acyltransferase n=1 Tax=uncultured Kushneria sp. TaxID=905033 RepID=UPI00261C3CCE|nr:PEP-CTERM/exosortase system-associated acyltransferase [uncultured Kushneria sp.]
MNRESFSNDYNVIFAVSEEEKKRVYSLRHAVYCEELGFEPVNIREGIEKDDFDERSLHCLIERKDNQQAVGCVRLVLPSRDKNSVFYQMPLEKKFAALLEDNEQHPNLLKRQEVCEISRVAILSDIRRISSARSHTSDVAEAIKTASLLKAGLFLSVLALGKISRRRYGFAMMEPSLARLLSYSGFKFSRVSQYLDFNGKRAIYYSDWQEAVGKLHPEMYELYEYIVECFSLSIVNHTRDIAEIAEWQNA